jgi:hypothetical protein
LRNNIFFSSVFPRRKYSGRDLSSRSRGRRGLPQTAEVGHGAALSGKSLSSGTGQVRKMLLFLSKTGSKNGFIFVKDRFEKWFHSCQRLVRKMVSFLSKTGSKNAFILVKDRFEKCFYSCQRLVRKTFLFKEVAKNISNLFFFSFLKPVVT